MGYFDDESYVAEYFTMVEGYDGTGVFDQLWSYLNGQSPVLELGMDSGTDLDLLKRVFSGDRF